MDVSETGDVADILRDLSAKLDGMADRIDREKAQARRASEAEVAELVAERDALAAKLQRSESARARLVRWGAGALGRLLGLRRSLGAARAESRAAREGLAFLARRVDAMQDQLDGPAEREPVSLAA
jgi:hypothetical protein